MNIGEWLGTIAVSLSLVGAGGTGVKFYGDTQWITVGAYQKGELRQIQREIKTLELEDDLSEKQKGYLEFLRLQEKQLQSEISK